jgi:hypothetical protein
MRRATIVLIVCVMLCSFVVASPRVVSACVCATPSVAQAEEQSVAVFSGRVTEIQEPSGRNSADPAYVTFETVRIWKGEPYATLIIATDSQLSSCRIGFGIGKTYLVYAQQWQERYYTSLCSRTVVVEEAQEDLTYLGEGRVPSKPIPVATIQAIPTRVPTGTPSQVPPFQYPYPQMNTSPVQENPYPIAGPAFVQWASERQYLMFLIIVGVIIGLLLRELYGRFQKQNRK